MARNCASFSVPVLADAAGEVHQRLLLGEGPEHLGGRFERRQLAVGVEDVELGVVGGERGVGVGVAIVGGGAGHGQVAAFADGQVLDGLGQRVAIVGEILRAP